MNKTKERWVELPKHDASYPLRPIVVKRVDVAQDFRKAPSLTNVLSRLGRIGTRNSGT